LGSLSIEVKGKKMSAEGKKKRGITGASNAKNIPFRYGGSKCILSTRIGATTHPRLAGSRLVNAAIYGLVVAKLGLGKTYESERMNRALDNAMANCTSPILT
jgi:hypothetical protein